MGNEALQNLSSLTINGEVNKNSDNLSVEETNAAKDAANKPIEVEKNIEKSNSFLTKLTALNSDKAFDPSNYTNTSITNDDIFPVLNKPIKVGEYQGKTIGSVSLFATSYVHPYSAIEKRRESLRASIATQLAKQQKTADLINSVYYPTAEQFNEEFNNRVFLNNREWLKKYNNNYTALSKDPAFIKQQHDFEQQAKALSDVHKYVFDIASQIKAGQMVSDEKRKIANEYITGTGNFDAEKYVNDVMNGKQKPTDLLAKIQRTETSDAFLKKENLDLFVKEYPLDFIKGKENKFYKISGGVGYSHSMLTTGKVTVLDKEAMMEGLQRFIQEHGIEGAGNPNAPKDSKDYKQWEEYSENIFNSAKQYKNNIAIDQKIFNNGEASRVANSIAAAKNNPVTYYSSVRDLVSKKDDMEKIRQIENAAERNKKYDEYMSKFPTTNKFGVKAIDLGVPVNKDGYWNTSNIGKSVTYKDGQGNTKTKILTPQQIIDIYRKGKPEVKGKDGKVFYGNSYGIDRDLVESAKQILKLGSGKFEKTAEFAFHSVKDGKSGKLIPMERSTGDGVHSKIYTTVGAHGHIIFQNKTSNSVSGVTNYEDIKGSHDWVVLTPIEEATQRAALESKATPKETTTEYQAQSFDNDF